MAELDRFRELLQRVRTGDNQAAMELVRQYEPLIRREVRIHLRDRRLSRLFDSMDVCQSVLGSFFVRIAAGQYDLERPEQLLALLVKMTRNKLVSAARLGQAQQRDLRRNSPQSEAELAEVEDPGPTPSRVIEGQDLLARFQRGLTPEERRLADLRSQGMTWPQIAEHLGGTAQARRVQFSRAVERVTYEMGLDSD
jgi:RNA polymerase sigma-70 factor (ECF subfamily)